MKQDSFHPQLTPEFITNALRLTSATAVIHRRPGPASEDPARRPFTSVCTDSRKIQPGCLFIALKGETFDGHAFIEASLKQGAAGVIYRKGFDVQIAAPAHQFRVEDTQEAFRQLAGLWRREFSIPTVVVAGSNGKTTTKELLAAILGGKWPRVLKTTGSQNGFLGIPMTLLELRPEHEAAVIEVGIDELGAMDQHMSLVAATAAVLTSIGPEHLEKLRDVPTVAREEGQAFVALATSTLGQGHGGLIAINLDDPWIRPHWSTLRGARRIGFTLRMEGLPSGIDRDAGEEFLVGTISADARELAVRGRKFPLTTFSLPLPGRHNASNLLAALAVARGLGLNPDELRRGLAGFRGAAGRTEIVTRPDGTVVLCDYYNASPPSVLAGLDVLNELAASGDSPARKRPRWACLADMRELGEAEEKFHRDLAPMLIESGIEHVLLFGDRMRALADELRKRGFAGELEHFDSREAMAKKLREKVKPGDALLIKGSHSMRMEQVYALFSGAESKVGS